jgi:hypothetical protein
VETTKGAARSNTLIAAHTYTYPHSNRFITVIQRCPKLLYIQANFLTSSLATLSCKHAISSVRLSLKHVPCPTRSARRLRNQKPILHKLSTYGRFRRAALAKKEKSLPVQLGCLEACMILPTGRSRTTSSQVTSAALRRFYGNPEYFRKSVFQLPSIVAPATTWGKEDGCLKSDTCLSFHLGQLRRRR